MANVICRNCGLYLIERCYARNWWFRLIREPLVWCMRILACLNHIDVWKYTAHHRSECRGCVRFLKAELEDKSTTYRFFDRIIGPRFKKLRDSMLQEAEFQEAKRIVNQEDVLEKK